MASRTPRTPRTPSTPWNDVRTQPRAAESRRRTPPGELRRIGRLLCCAAFSAATIVLLFRPWLSVSGPGGTIRSDAFGTLGTEGKIRDSWASTGIPTVEVSGAWAVLACVAAVAAIVAAVAYLRTRIPLFAHATAASGSAVAAFVLADVLYLNTTQYELHAAVEDSGPSGLIGAVLGDAATTGQPAGAHLGIVALLAGVTAVGAAVSALMNYRPVVSAGQAAAPIPAPVTERAETISPLPSAPEVVGLPAPIAPVPTADQAEPAYRVLELPPSAATKESSWRIVIPAAEAYGKAPGVRTVIRANR